MKEEKHSTRDLRYSKFHRSLHRSLYWMDLDAVEYDKDANPVGCLELKHHNNIEENEFQTQCLQRTADLLKVPGFRITYYPIGWDDVRKMEEAPPDWGFKFDPLNQLANNVMEELNLIEGKKYNSKDYEQFLLFLRRIK